MHLEEGAPNALTPPADIMTGTASGLPMLAAAILFVTACMVLAKPVRAQPPSEAAVKAAFVYNFAKFIEWPGESLVGVQGNVTLCTSGVPEDLADALSALEGKSVQNRSLSVRRDPGAAELDACHVLFVGDQPRARAELGRGKPGLLTVSDIPGFAAAGGVIELFNEGSKIRFEINPEAAKRAGLKVSAQLMKLARITPGR